MHVGIEIAAECSSEVFTEGKSPRSPVPPTTLASPTTSCTCLPSESKSVSSLDIGKLLATDTRIVSKLIRDERYCILTSPTDPNPLHYPRTRCHGSSSFRQFQPGWIKQYPWLIYSRHVDGVFCRACVFFAPEKVALQSTGQFVINPFNTWVSKSQKMNAHASLEYHMASVAKMNEFVAGMKHPAATIDSKFDKEEQMRFEENCTVIESLLKVVILCGKQGLALRGHRDDRIDLIEEEDDKVSENYGNFLELVHFRAETDAALRKHLEHAPKNALYTSKTIQNELIKVIGSRIQSDIISEVKEAMFYSIIADEVTDIANREQLSLVLRYVINGKVKEVFTDFLEVERITGEALADAILKTLETWGLPVANVRGQCYDGGSNMAGAKSGCRAIVQRQAPMAIYVHCALHWLNLAIISACKIQAFKNKESCVGEIARFFRFSPKRQRYLERAIDLMLPQRS